MSEAGQPVDWEAIERDYRTGTVSVRELGRWYGLSDTAIRKKAKAEGWERSSQAPSSRREPANPPAPPTYIGTVLTPENASPEMIVGRGRNLVLRMLDELDATTSRVGELESIIDTAVDEGDGGKQRDAVRQAVSLKQRAEVLKALALASKTLAESGAPAGKKAERQAAAEKATSKFAVRPPPAVLSVN